MSAPFNLATSRVGGGPVSKMIIGGILVLGDFALYFTASDLGDATNNLIGLCVGLGFFAWGYYQRLRAGRP